MQSFRVRPRDTERDAGDDQDNMWPMKYSSVSRRLSNDSLPMHPDQQPPTRQRNTMFTEHLSSWLDCLASKLPDENS